MTLTRWDPFRELSDIRRTMDRLFDEGLARAADDRDWPERPAMPVPIDMYERDDELVIRASLPGLKPEDVQISVTGNVLTIQGEYEDKDERDQEGFYVRERRFGAFRRSVRLPSDVDADQIEATSQDGVLKITAPKTEESKPKTIPVKGH